MKDAGAFVPLFSLYRQGRTPMKKPMRKEDQDTRPAFNLLCPFSIEDFPELAEKQGLTKRTPTQGNPLKKDQVES